MLGEQLIEQAVESYNKCAEELKHVLESKEIDIKEVNRLFGGLKTHRKAIKLYFKDNPFLKLYKPEVRRVIKEIRDNKDLYRSLVVRLAIKIIKDLRGEKMGIEEINKLFEGFKERQPILTIDWSEDMEPTILGSIIKPIISKKLIKRIQYKENSDEKLLKELIEEIEEEPIEDYYPDFGDWVSEIESRMGNFEHLLQRLIEAGAIVVGTTSHSNIAGVIIGNFGKVRDCYMFGLYEATIVLCRTLLETSLKEYYKNKNPKIPKETIYEMSLHEVLKKVDLSEGIKKETYKIKKEANLILHKGKVINNTEALSAIKATTRIVEGIFET